MHTIPLLFCILVATTGADLPWYNGRPYPGASTQGGVWPLPWSIKYDAYNHTINPAEFRFDSQVGACDVIDRALARYQKLSFPMFDPKTYKDSEATLTTLAIKVKSDCDSTVPQMEMDESYSLNIQKDKATAILIANEVWGALRGLETFSQLVYQIERNKYRIRTASVKDTPRFSHRGTLIDTARHFLPIPLILEHLDLMSQNKFNVLHWHIVDSEAFPYTSAAFPNMSLEGAYTPAHIYSIADIKKVIDYARLRGIRVVAEFDTPGHSGSWGKSIPNLLSDCYDDKGKIDQLPNIIDPTLDTTYNFLRDFFREALELFQDSFMHFGGDEVEADMQQCWENNKAVRARMEAMGYNTTHQLLNHYWNRLFEVIHDVRPGTKKVVWQEVLDMGVKVKNAIAHVWKGGSYGAIMDEMAKVTAAGHRTILSSCWYLDWISIGADWKGYYNCDPTGFKGTDEQKGLVLGGEAALWGEYVDATNFIARMWPRASAVAERLWSNPTQTKSTDVAWPRLHEFRCRMVNRGFAVQPPNAPDYCPYEWNYHYEEL
ncbi:hypothetical protein Q1695_002498 [Nippostrongylus brasiliensis]|nr:hypothetical protein Q1695_002498 [Nippostrongylus brasiliensis]